MKLYTRHAKISSKAIVVLLVFVISKFLSVLFYCSCGVICISDEAGRF